MPPEMSKRICLAFAVTENSVSIALFEKNEGTRKPERRPRRLLSLLPPRTQKPYISQIPQVFTSQTRSVYFTQDEILHFTGESYSPFLSNSVICSDCEAVGV